MKFWLYGIRAMWRVSRGRWFVWRDAPVEIVEQYAEMLPYLKPTDEPALVGMVAQAVQELELREQHG